MLARFAIALGALSIVLAAMSIAIAVDASRDDNPPRWGWSRCVPFEIVLGRIESNVCVNNRGTFWINGSNIGRWNGPTHLMCYALDTRTPKVFETTSLGICGDAQ